MAVVVMTPVFLISQTNQSQFVELSVNNSGRSVNNDTTWMHYDDVENWDAWGFMISGELYDVMAKWDPADLVNYETWVITKVKFIVVHDLPIIKVKVWEGASGVEIYSQDVPNYNMNDWTVVTLNQPVEFDHTTELMVGYEVDMTMTELGGAVTATDDGPPEDGYGNLYRWNGGWYSDFNNHNLRVQIQNNFNAEFTVSQDSICVNGTVDFTDISVGNITSWNWTFEGGTPATSTDQNPSVTYNSTGTFDVTLVVSDGTNIDTTYIENMITVLNDPATPTMPMGTTEMCAGETTQYTTLSVPEAEEYFWSVSPEEAGTISGSDTIGTFYSDVDYSGTYYIKVSANNICSTSPSSDSLECTLNAMPQSFQLSNGGGVCEGSQGIELTQDGSETGVDYELYLEDISTGIIVSGDGNAISFGYHTEVGIYTVTGFTAFCDSQMFGTPYIYLLDSPEQGNIPTGNTDVCAGSTEDYTVAEITNADSTIWNLDPSDAGTIIGNGLTISIEWSIDFSGIANLTTQGYNDCGTGAVSDPLEISISESPTPDITGESLVCDEEESEYSTSNNSGSTYSWVVDGGEIVSGTGTYLINILWGEPGIGTVQVTEILNNDCEGISEIFEVEIDDCTNINNNNSESMVSIVTNPVSGNYMIVNKTIKEEITVQILDINGRIIHQQKLNYHTTKVETAKLNKGIYFLKALFLNGDASVQKFIKN